MIKSKVISNLNFQTGKKAKILKFKSGITERVFEDYSAQLSGNNVLSNKICCEMYMIMI